MTLTPDGLDEMGPIDYLVVEFPGSRMTGKGLPMLVDLRNPVYENRWAAPLARQVRRGGGQLVASGRIPVQALLAALDAAEAST